MDRLNIFQPFSTVSKNFYSGHKVSFIFIELLNITLLIYFKYISERCGENSASCGKVYLVGKHSAEIHRRLSIPRPLSLEEKENCEISEILCVNYYQRMLKTEGKSGIV